MGGAEVVILAVTVQTVQIVQVCLSITAGNTAHRLTSLVTLSTQGSLQQAGAQNSQQLRFQQRIVAQAVLLTNLASLAVNVLGLDHVRTLTALALTGAIFQHNYIQASILPERRGMARLCDVEIAQAGCRRQRATALDVLEECIPHRMLLNFHLHLSSQDFLALKHTVIVCRQSKVHSRTDMRQLSILALVQLVDDSLNRLLRKLADGLAGEDIGDTLVITHDALEVVIVLLLFCTLRLLTDLSLLLFAQLLLAGTSTLLVGSINLSDSLVILFLTDMRHSRQLLMGCHKAVTGTDTQFLQISEHAQHVTDTNALHLSVLKRRIDCHLCSHFYCSLSISINLFGISQTLLSNIIMTTN